MERRLTRAADPLNVAPDERGLLLLATAGLVLFLCLLALHSPAAVHTASQRPSMEDAWLSQWMVRGAEQPWSDQERAALHTKLNAATVDSRPVEDSHVAHTTSFLPYSTLAVTVDEDESSPLPVAFLSSSTAITELGFTGVTGVPGTACSRVSDRAKCGERRQCSGRGQCVIRGEHCQGFYHYREWACECQRGWSGVWCQVASSGCNQQLHERSAGE